MAYYMRISYWSSDVCSSDLTAPPFLSLLRFVPGIRHALHVIRHACLRPRACRHPRHRRRTAFLRPSARSLHLPAPGPALRIRLAEAEAVDGVHGRLRHRRPPRAHGAPVSRHELLLRNLGFGVPLPHTVLDSVFLG